MLKRILTEVAKPNVFQKIGVWIKVNPVLFAVAVVTGLLVIGFVTVTYRKQNKKKKKRK